MGFDLNLIHLDNSAFCLDEGTSELIRNAIDSRLIETYCLLLRVIGDFAFDDTPALVSAFLVWDRT